MKELKFNLKNLWIMTSSTKFYLFENTIGKYFNIPETAEKPEFEIIMRIKK